MIRESESWEIARISNVKGIKITAEVFVRSARPRNRPGKAAPTTLFGSRNAPQAATRVRMLKVDSGWSKRSI